MAKYFNRLSLKNAKLMLSNSNPKNVNENDNFFEEIYKGFCINEVSAKRMINSNVKGRGEISELLITNYEEQLKLNYQINSTLDMVAISARSNLREIFDRMDNIYNIADMKNGIMQEIFR